MLRVLLPSSQTNLLSKACILAAKYWNTLSCMFRKCASQQMARGQALPVGAGIVFARCHAMLAKRASVSEQQVLCREGLPQDSLVGSLAIFSHQLATGRRGATSSCSIPSTKFLIHQGTANVTVQQQRASDSMARGMTQTAEALGSAFFVPFLLEVSELKSGDICGELAWASDVDSDVIVRSVQGVAVRSVSSGVRSCTSPSLCRPLEEQFPRQHENRDRRIAERIQHCNHPHENSQSV